MKTTYSSYWSITMRAQSVLIAKCWERQGAAIAFNATDALADLITIVLGLIIVLAKIITITFMSSLLFNWYTWCPSQFLLLIMYSLAFSGQSPKTQVKSLKPR